jgi:hypothetical protein
MSLSPQVPKKNSKTSMKTGGTEIGEDYENITHTQTNIT